MPDPRIKEATDEFHHCYFIKYKRKYLGWGGKQAKLLQGLLTYCDDNNIGLEPFYMAMHSFFASDGWELEVGHMFEVFHKKFGSYLEKPKKVIEKPKEFVSDTRPKLYYEGTFLVDEERLKGLIQERGESFVRGLRMTAGLCPPGYLQAVRRICVELWGEQTCKKLFAQGDIGNMPK